MTVGLGIVSAALQRMLGKADGRSAWAGGDGRGSPINRPRSGTENQV
jgi:hypothetical protein